MAVIGEGDRERIKSVSNRMRQPATAALRKVNHVFHF